MTIHLGDCIEVMAGMPADSVDAVVTDPRRGRKPHQVPGWGFSGGTPPVDDDPAPPSQKVRTVEDVA